MECNRRWLAASVLVAPLLLGGCGQAEAEIPWMTVEVVTTRPHDPRAFTEGLEIDGAMLYESTGMSGESSVSASSFHDGSVGTEPPGDSGTELARAELPAPYFGEGITSANDTLWQLTWKDHIAFARDPNTLAERGRVSFDGEGWGLCARGDRLVMSDGADRLTFRDPVTFAPTGSVRLTSHHSARLNELDCAADGSVYANDWPTDNILRIDPDSGQVLALIDAHGLLPLTVRAGTDALNGIAQIPGTDRFLLTGKYWPTMFEVRFVAS